MRCPSCRQENPEDAKFCSNCGTSLRAAPAEATAELRQLTVLFCDLVGSTSLSESLDPEDLRELIGMYHSVCEAVIRKHDGHISQFLGDGVLGTSAIRSRTRMTRAEPCAAAWRSSPGLRCSTGGSRRSAPRAERAAGNSHGAGRRGRRRGR